MTESQLGPASPTPAALKARQPLRLNGIRLDPAGLFGTWQRRNAEATLPHCVGKLADTGILANMRRVAAGGGTFHGLWFADSDIYKTLEAAAWQLASTPDDEALHRFLDETVELLAAAQEEDGYLNSYFQTDHPEKRFQELLWSHELYCAGHLIQAAVAADRSGAPAGTPLMVVARRLADLLVRRFGPDGTDGVCGHPEIETALVELYRSTGHRPYLHLAQRMVDLRGKGLLPKDQLGPAYYQDHAPVREAEEVTGHVVRQLYLLAGVVDVAVETGDLALLGAAERLWDSAFGSKTYLTGAQGSRHRDEAFGDPYELPPDRAYGETCAAIASFQWNWRMLLATGGHRYADEMERVLYNAIAGATALSGRHFFYSNPLQLRAGHDGSIEDSPSQRLSWYHCPCCPPNLARLFATLHGYLATTDGTGLQVHQYTNTTIHSGQYTVDVSTAYPWDERVTLTVSGGAEPWTLALRVPGWCTDHALTVDGTPVEQAPVDGYLRLTRSWAGGATVQLDLRMPARLVTAHPYVDAVRGCAALTRGPLVYCLEQADLPAGLPLEDVRLDSGAPLRIQTHGPDAPIPVSLVASGTRTRPGAPALYRYDPAGAGEAEPVTLTAIPYFLWGNRAAGPMRVWIPAP
jgi:DUF1680 family protein